ncbi:carbohydrate-binding protein [Paenibacillus sacheonensis]|uniref:Carbohydrate-binding protein n=1 Tax=Paenibacillus sacheonensis TaxID=742054 RepID=A0A7X4YPE4_9BACL|nr:carbohydrate-binding protein [Paenibacillus sacheonensis]MBM7565130.1 putative alpha-1,6-mannanase (GH76 family) [Paenibacillus sacheonensis]NBC70087.1 carbohydrate-binding protein [Paenibacillus sacheonensis]
MTLKTNGKLWVWTTAAAVTLASWSGIGASQAHASTETTGHSVTASFNAADADTAMKAFNRTFWDSAAKFFWSNSNQGTSYQGFWVEAELWEMVMDAYERTSDPELKAQLRQQIDDVFDGTVASYGPDWTNNHFNDDIMWWAMASARAYKITGEQRYLDKAKYYFDFVYDTQWDDGFANGGIWWMNSDHSTKNACINFPAAEAAVFLYNATKDDHYLDAATRIYRWSKTVLTDGSGKVFDRIEVKNGVAPDATHYNQGTFIGAAVGLYKITGNGVYLDDAIKAADFTEQHLVDGNGVLRFEGPNGDLKGGKTILLRNLAYLQQAVNERQDDKTAAFAGQFNEWLTFNANAAWHNRNANNIVDGNWGGQLLAGTYESWSSAAAVEALTILRPGTSTLQDTARDAYARTETETYNVGSGFGLEGSGDGTLQLGGIQSGGFAAFTNVDFGSSGAVGMIARASSATGGGNIEVHLDSLDGPKAGTLNVQGTGSWNTFSDATAVLKDDQGQPSTITGVHDVYLVFKKTNDDYLFNLNWFKFTTTDPTKTDAYARLKAVHADGSGGLTANTNKGILDGIHDNAYAFFKGIDLGTGAAGITAHVASGGQGGSIEVKLDSLNGPTVGTLGVPALGGWDSWVDLMSNIDDTQAKGIHDVYLVFHGTDGSDYPCNLDWFTFTTVKGKARDAYGKLEAENTTGGTGFGTENGGGQTYLAGINAATNPYAMYNYIDFGDTSPTQMNVNAASDTSGGTIEVRIDSMNGPIIASAQTTGTGGWQKFAVTAAPVTTPVTGKHIVFLLFKGNGYLFNVDKFTFGDPAVFTAPDVPPVTVPDGIAPGEVENVQVIRDNGAVRLYWDGPYDIDATQVKLQPVKGEQPAGELLTVGKGIQSAAWSDLADATAIVIKAVDASGNVSSGTTVNLADYPAFTLTADGSVLKDGATVEDGALLRFKAADRIGAIKSAAIAFDGHTYAVHSPADPTVDIDLASMSGAKSAVITIEDVNGSTLRQTFAFTVTVSIHSMQQLIDRYQRSEQLRGALVSQLTNELDKAQRMLDGQKRDQASKAIQDFVKHLNNKAQSGSVTADAKAVLNKDAEAVIQSLK